MALLEGRRLLLCFLYGISVLFLLSSMLYYYKQEGMICATPVTQRASDLEYTEPVFQRYNTSCKDLSASLDYSRCPLHRPFLVYVYNSELGSPSPVLDNLTASLQCKNSWTAAPAGACLFIVYLGAEPLAIQASELEQRLHSLSHWKRSGTNHVLINLATPQHTSTLLGGIDTGAAIVVTSYTTPQFSTAPLHILTPPIIPPDAMNVSDPLNDPISLFSMARDHLLYFEGKHESKINHPFGDLSDLRSGVDITTDCSKSGNVVLRSFEGEWALCGSVESRLSHCSRSSFSLVLGGSYGMMGAATYTRLVESLRCGAVPVIVGVNRLPFDQVINWQRAALVIPQAQISIVLGILATIGTEEIVGYRKQGRFLLDTYFSSEGTILETVIAILRSKTMHPPPPIPDFPATVLVKRGGHSPFPPAPRFQNNFSVYTEALWNSPPGPFYMYPVSPFRNPYNPDMIRKPVGNSKTPVLHHSAGLTGVHFQKELYGNSPKEGFTMLVMTYKRNAQLLKFLSTYRGCPYLAKMLVVWNNEEDPPSNMPWPNIGVPLEVVRTGRNNLNNRFLPFESIQTDAVFSLDDDQEAPHSAIEFAFREVATLSQYLRFSLDGQEAPQSAIEFAFRVWRENRHALVGWFTRFHEWHEDKWVYRTGTTCQPSFVLTGAVFFHKYYSYLYSYWMPQGVREMVATHMNGEDIAMNFLVAHITGRPPVKVDSHGNFDCKTCHSGLSSHGGYYEERDECVNTAAKVWGFNPLLYTQTRVEPSMGDNHCLLSV